MKKYMIFFICLLFMLNLLSGCKSTSDEISQEEKEVIELQKEKEQSDQDLKDFAIVNGIIDAQIFDYDLENSYTMDAQQKYQGKNVVFYSSINDIYIENERYYLICSDFYNNIIIILECDKDIISYIRTKTTYNKYNWENDEFKVIANIESIKGLQLMLAADSYTGDPEDGYYVYLEDYREGFEVKGRCIALEFVQTEE